jgi:hypothetical protein
LINKRKFLILRVELILSSSFLLLSVSADHSYVVLYLLIHIPNVLFYQEYSLVG